MSIHILYIALPLFIHHARHPSMRAVATILYVRILNFAAPLRPSLSLPLLSWYNDLPHTHIIYIYMGAKLSHARRRRRRRTGRVVSNPDHPRHRTRSGTMDWRRDAAPRLSACCRSDRRGGAAVPGQTAPPTPGRRWRRRRRSWRTSSTTTCASTNFGQGIAMDRRGRPAAARSGHRPPRAAARDAAGPAACSPRRYRRWGRKASRPTRAGPATSCHRSAAVPSPGAARCGGARGARGAHSSASEAKVGTRRPGACFAAYLEHFLRNIVVRSPDDLHEFFES